MKCSKCGEEYNENQAFCLKCGNPIEILKDLDHIEEEISNNVEEFMGNSMRKYAESTLDEDDFPIEIDFSDYIPIDGVRKGLNVIGVDKPDKSVVVLDDEDEDEIASEFNGRHISNTKRKNPKDNKAGRKNGKKNKKKNIGTAIGVIVIIILIAAIIGVAYKLIFGNDNATFNRYYDNAMTFYEKSSYDAASSEFIRADNAANSKEQHIKAKEMLWKTYSAMEGKEIETIAILEELIKLNPDKLEYYEALIVLYQNTDNTAKLEALMEAVKGNEIGEKLADYDFSVPTFSVESGEYFEPISVEIKSIKGYVIYYTKNGKDPTVDSKVYKKPLVFGDNGEVTLKAIAVSPKGIKSEVVTVTYKLNAITNPVIVPDSGEYTELTKIKITVPEGAKAYYTLDETDPSKESIEYKEEFDMPLGNTVLKVIIYNSADVPSNIAQRVYRLVPYRAYSYDAALDKLKNVLVIKNILENVNGLFNDGSEMEFSYMQTEVIDSKEYYLIKTIHNATTQIYAVSCSEGEVSIANEKDGKYKLDSITQ